MTRAKQFDIDKYYEYKNFLNECANKKYQDNLVLHKHHIIPRHLCVNEDLLNSRDNIIKLSVEDHVTAHLMLAEMYDAGTYENISNLRAARIISHKSIRDKEVLEKISNSYRGKNNPFYGKRHSPETMEIIKAARRKRKNLTYEEIYGESHAAIEKQKRAKKTRTDAEYKEAAKKAAETAKRNKSHVGSKNAWAQPLLIDDKYFGSRKEAEKFYKKAFETIQRHHTVIRIPKHEKQIYEEKYHARDYKY
jgi:hypothetical protein